MSPRLLFALICVIVGLAAISVAGARVLSTDDLISACYSNANGNVRIIDPASEPCRSGESSVSWNRTGPPGPPGSSGPTSVSASGTEIDNFGTIIVSHTTTAAEAGLTLITATANVKDMDGSQGGVRQVNCGVMLGNAGAGDVVTLRETGISDQGDTASWTLLRRDVLEEGQPVGVRCEPLGSLAGGPSGVFVIAHLMLQHVKS